MNMVASVIACTVLIGLLAMILYACGKNHPVATTLVVGAYLLRDHHDD